MATTKTINGLLYIKINGCFMDADTVISIFNRQQTYIDMLLKEVEALALNEADFSAQA